MSDHFCRCPNCQPGEFPDQDSGRMDENHFAVRFGDTKRVEGITLNGEVVQDVMELHIGDHGFIVRLARNPDNKVHLCECRHGVCSEMLFGKVEATVLANT